MKYKITKYTAINGSRKPKTCSIETDTIEAERLLLKTAHDAKSVQLIYDEYIGEEEFDKFINRRKNK